MITTVQNTMIPRYSFTAPDTGYQWLYFEYDGTYDDFKNMPNTIKKDNVFFVKKGHNSDTMTVAYGQIPLEDIVFKAAN